MAIVEALRSRAVEQAVFKKRFVELCRAGSTTNVLEAPSDGNNMDQTGIREQIADQGEGRGGEGRKEGNLLPTSFQV
jgi:hypothetical protein